LNSWLTEKSTFPNYLSYNLLTGWTSGVAMSYSNEKYDFEVGGNTKLHNVQGALYFLQTKSSYYALFDFVFGSTLGKLERPIRLKQICYDAHSEIDISQMTFYGEFGLNNLCWCSMTIQPFLGLEIGSYSLSSMKEHGAEALNLKIDDRTSNITSSYVGVHLYRSFEIDNSWGIAADLAWKHMFDFEEHLKQGFTVFGSTFDVSGAEHGNDGIEGSLAVFKALGQSWMINVNISGEKWANYGNVNVYAGISYTW
jgi:uncharacterized protein with beta-barrel porin domain